MDEKVLVLISWLLMNQLIWINTVHYSKEGILVDYQTVVHNICNKVHIHFSSHTVFQIKYLIQSPSTTI